VGVQCAAPANVIQQLSLTYPSLVFCPIIHGGGGDGGEGRKGTHDFRLWLCGGIEGKIILKRILKIQSVKVWS
jgi:hypothetical protein